MDFIALRRKLLFYSKKKSFWLWIGFYTLILFIYLINGRHEQYPDEFDNVLGGWYLLQGKLIYSDWFSHHGPLAYVVASVVEIFSRNSFVGFRFVYSIFLFFLTVLPFLFIRRQLKGIDIPYYFYFIILVALGSTYFWGHMLLADNLSAFLLLPVFVLIFLKVMYNRVFEKADYIFISIFSFLALMSALTYSFLVAGIYAFLFVYYFVGVGKKFKIRDLVSLLAIIFIPYLTFLVYLIITGSLDDYFNQAIKFNRDYYIYYPGHEGKPPANPLRYAIVIAQGFHNNFSSMLNTIKGFNFDFPFNIALAVSNLSLGVYLLLKKKYLLFLFVLGTLIFANARTNPFDSRETDYQLSVYILISLFITSYAIYTIYKELNTNIEYAKKLILSLVFVVLLIYSFYNFTFLLRKFSYKTYDKYMGFTSQIYDRPKVAPYINQIVEKNDIAWIGPFAFEDLLYMDANLPSKFHVFLPGMGKSEKFTSEMLSEFNRNKPSVIYYNRDYYILGASPKEYGKPFLNFLNSNYITLSTYQEGAYKYSTSIDPSLEFDKKLFIRKDAIDEVIAKMQSLNYVEND